MLFSTTLYALLESMQQANSPDTIASGPKGGQALGAPFRSRSFRLKVLLERSCQAGFQILHKLPAIENLGVEQVIEDKSVDDPA